MAIVMYYTSQRNYMPGKEFGTARFENPKQVNKILADKDENFNRILSQNVKMSLDFRRFKLNGNILICGGSGAGKTFYEVLKLLGEAEVTEQGKASKLDVRMKFLEESSPLGANHPAVKQYNKCMRGAGDTVRSIIISANSRLAFLENKQVLRLLSKDELNLSDIGIGVNGDGETKTALFCVIPDSDKSYNFIIGMLYTQIFQELYYQADFNCGGRLPIHVTFMLDEFANVALPDDFCSLLSTMRSREISSIIIIQNFAQLKALFKDTWETIPGNCDTFIYLGGNEQSTHKYVSELLGKGTIDKKSSGETKGRQGSSSRNYDVLGRELFTPDEVRKLDNKKCIIFIRGFDPIMDNKFISKNVNIGNRKKLINGNGFVFGVPGSGKSFFCKMEMGSVFLSGDDEIIVIDPMNEYFDIAETYGGTVVNMSTYTDNYVNPLEMDVWSLDPNDSKGMVREKGEFMLGLCEQCIGDSLNSRQKSIIDRCVRKLYIDIARSKEKYIPVMSDFYDILMAQPEDEAKDIALSLELFVNGSLNIFNHQTNVDVDNRFTVYGIRDLGTELSPITMLVMMESIQNRIVENGKRGKATWLYIDEFHVLLNSEYSAKYLQQLWKKVRKQGGLCTGITQNVIDLLQNYTATTMLANSEFVALLKQANTDSSKMAEVIGVSEAQLRFVTNTASGMGLIKCGSVVIPFDNQISKDTDLYRLYNTNIHEKIAEKKAKLKIES